VTFVKGCAKPANSGRKKGSKNKQMSQITALRAKMISDAFAAGVSAGASRDVRRPCTAPGACEVARSGGAGSSTSR
jgi:hypothetical protein